MKRIFKSILPYWKSVILIFVFLLLQAYCDLSLPQYTSNIIDTGIQNGGIEHAMPELITSDEFEKAVVFMSDDEEEHFRSVYEKEDDNYRLKVTKNNELDKLDDEFSMAFIMNNQMSAVEESQFKQQMASFMGVDEQIVNNMTTQQLAAQLGIQLETFTRQQEDSDGNMTDVTCVDMRTIFEAMVTSGKMTKDNIISIRNDMEEKFSSVGSTMLKSMGVAYAKSMDSKAGLDMDKIQSSYLLSSGLKMITMALLMAAATVIVGLIASRIGAGIGRDLRSSVYGRVMKFSNAEMDKFSTASLITRTTNDIQQIQMVIVMMLRMILYAPILGIGGIVKVFNTGAGMEWIIGLAVLIILGIVMILMVVAMPKFKLMQKLVDAVNLVSREILTGLSVIRAFRREEKEEQRFDEANKKLTKTTLFTNRVMTFMMPLMTFIMYGITVLIVWVASNKIDDGTLQVGAMTAFITYTMQIVMSFLMLTMMSIMLPRSAVAADRIDEVLKTESSIKDTDSPEKLENVKGVLEFNDVSFKYPGSDENAIADISFKAEPGKTTAIIGSTGCGKSTLVNLIPRLYDVTQGSITLDGHDIRNITMKDLREELGYVPQKGILFSGNIASNLRFGKEDATDEQIEEAAQIAQATEFIESKNARYETPIAQGGTNVSGGQKQRLSIARAIAKNPKIYIFDDSFSALDLKTDAALRKALASKVGDSTVIIVAQRISTILHAEQILVMDEGRIVGRGTHSELLENCEVYRQIAKSQLSEKELGIDRKEDL
jgi:ATP-binding cassette subfamily B multidrug efflux pump